MNNQACVVVRGAEGMSALARATAVPAQDELTAACSEIAELKEQIRPGAIRMATRKPKSSPQALAYAKAYRALQKSTYEVVLAEIARLRIQVQHIEAEHSDFLLALTSALRADRSI